MKSLKRTVLSLFVLFFSFASLSPAVGDEVVNDPMDSNRWSIDLRLDAIPFDGMALGYGANIMYYFNDKVGAGLFGQMLFDSVGANNYLEAEIGARLKYFAHGDVNSSGVVLSPYVVIIDWMDRNTVSISKQIGVRAGLDASYEWLFAKNFFLGAGAGVGVYLARPSISFAGTTALWSSTLSLDLFLQIGTRF
ncbi:MAG: hypothetical protein H6617_10090 [Bdellovibrionaceae bacterium]|nr:hypothetical protein [Bdellovibrionales bacterium]MCB9255020.1 hypothetical protein [Pseudobdellovibrionaceae bacterium]